VGVKGDAADTRTNGGPGAVNCGGGGCVAALGGELLPPEPPQALRPVDTSNSTATGERTPAIERHARAMLESCSIGASEYRIQKRESNPARARGAREETVMLVVIGGLPGTGKTAIARKLAIRRAAVYLRIDAIEQAIRLSGALAADVGPAGYFVANALAASNLANGLTVVADCVNPVRESRQGWQRTAALAQTRIVEAEIVCSDPLEHRHRVETRQPDIAGQILPTWNDVLQHDYAPWEEPHVVIDTARLTLDEAIAIIERHLAA
jgi:predicted kinase